MKMLVYDHYLANKVYLGDITVANIFRSFTHKMATKTRWHRYGSKLRHCHLMYCCFLVCVFCPCPRLHIAVATVRSEIRTCRRTR